MVKITREEVLKLAKMSRIHIHEDEIDPLIEQLKSVLSYAQRVSEISGDVQIASSKNSNIFRPDVVHKTDSKLILEQAPQVEDNYFVVLPILDK
jgi:aspartyl-tRNA(Asn)/glutamyl-tRNA(Gln) amidotransferase subunit C